jgi:hypothetical protein
MWYAFRVVSGCGEVYWISDSVSEMRRKLEEAKTFLGGKILYESQGIVVATSWESAQQKLRNDQWFSCAVHC